ncbi:hypothetical protein BLNAU_19349 [Blattamonas nauphoetae]|uniref:Right handed beta helix domain-containing protein n=1 Tax=Blattamonas nauphoetae TaxID=2049346 RepID=A0ABQ9X1T5_9EUKA|nr:hypothetical protein BLNAU_19349 [Blattamonas nauphoetae]
MMDQHLIRDFGNNEQNDDVLHLSPDVFELLDYPVMSKTMKLEGHTSTISHANPERQAVINELENDRPQHLNQIAKDHMDTSHSLFLFDNSTVSLSKVIFDCGRDGMALAKVSSSEVVVSSSKIVSNSKQTAFVVGTGLDGVGSSISVIDCSHISSSSMVLLPLVRTSTCLPATPHDSSSMDTPHSDSLPPFLSVSGAGLVLSNVSLILGTGPLLDFGLLSHDSTESDEIGLGEISTLLVGSVLRNVTSHGCSRSGLVVARGLCQKLVGTSLTLSTSHLSGTGCLDINAFGSFGCVNTSFSHCSSNAATTEQFTHVHRTGQDRYLYHTTNHTTLTFHLCTFTSIPSFYDGASVYVRANYVISMTECSFKDIQGRGGGALHIESLTRGEGSLAISLCSFVDCVGQDFGAALNHQGSSLFTLDKCFFKNMTTTKSSSFGGALCVKYVDTTTISECVFMDCAASDEGGSGGALYIQNSSFTMATVQFRGNSAPSGNDVFISEGCGSRDELETRVSDYYTDKFDTSLLFMGFEVQSSVIQQFESSTTIISLELTLNDIVSEGTITVVTEHAVKGKMLLLLDNTGEYVKIMQHSSPPATCRVVVVDFQTLSTTGTSEVLSFGDSGRLQFPSNYTPIAASISATRIEFTPPRPSLSTGDPPRVRKLFNTPGTNIGEVMVWLEGHKLSVGDYTIHFEGSPSLSLNVTFDEDQEGKTNQMSSLVSVGQGGNCQEKDSVCKTLDSAFETATKKGIKSIELNLVISEILSKTRSISDENEVFVTQGGFARPSLIVPSTFSSTPLVVISVSNASLLLADVDALIHSSSLDLKLVLVSSGSFEFSNGTIAYEPSSTTNSEIGNADSDLCSWTTGTIELVNSTAVFKSCSLTNLVQGGIMQSGGNVSLRDVYFLSNGQARTDFPSARRNVMCSSDGTLFVGGLIGDGRSHLFPGSGISGDGCSVSGTVTTMSIPFLDSYHSQITRDKKTGKYILFLVGSGFLPCGLQLEIFTSLEDGNSEESLTLDVDTDTASLFTETEIEIFVTPYDVANLSKKSEWKVRLLNGDRSIASQTLVLREEPRSMLWLIPVIVVVVVIAGGIVAHLLIWRCRSKKPVEKKEDSVEKAKTISPSAVEEVFHAVYVDLRTEISIFHSHQNGISNENAIRLGNKLYHTESLLLTSSLSERKYAKWRHLEDTGEQDGNGKHSCFAELVDEFGVYLDDNEREHGIISIYPQTPFLIWASTTPLNYCWIGAIPGQL